MLTEILISFFVNLVLSLLLMRKTIKYAYRKRLFDEPDERKIHRKAIPRVGGFAFVLSALITFVVMFTAQLLTGCDADWNFADGVTQHGVCGVICSILVVYVFGIIDDLHGLRYRTKFSYQILTGLLLCLVGIYLLNLYGLSGLYEIPSMFGCLVTVFLLVFVINAYNFIDGIDGLSSGLAIMSLVYYSFLLYSNHSILLLLAVAFLGALIPFFGFNMFGSVERQSKTFMGDSGSTVLGLVLFILAVVINGDPHTQELGLNPMVMVMAPLLLPCYDVINVVIFRLANSKNPFKADKNHFHHRLLQLGLSQHATLVVELLAAVVIAGSLIVLSHWVDFNILFFALLMLWLLVNMILTRIITNKNTEL